jgi:hypothetical protein
VSSSSSSPSSGAIQESGIKQAQFGGQKQMQTCAEVNQRFATKDAVDLLPKNALFKSPRTIETWD